MITIETTIESFPPQSVRPNAPPLSLPEAASRAHLYALTGVPIEAQGNMRLVQALIFARQHNLRRPSREDVQAAFARATSLTSR